MSEIQMCSICHKRVASVFISKIDETGNTVNQGICLVCAKEMGLPQVDSLLDKMGISAEDLENINDEMTNVMESLENGGDEDTQQLIEEISNETEDNPSETHAPDFMQFLKNMGFGGMMPPRMRNEETENKNNQKEKKS